MKKRCNIFWLGLLAIFLSCSETNHCDVGALIYPNQGIKGDSVAFAESKIENRQHRIQTFTFDTLNQFYIETTGGTIITAYRDLFRMADGTMAQGEITFSILECYQPGAAIACQLSTNGVNDEQSVEPLLSEGMLWIEVTHQGQELTMAGSYQLFMPSGNQNLNLSLFTASCQQLACDPLWEQEVTAAVSPEMATNAAGESIDGYQSALTAFGWISYARYNTSASSRVSLFHKVPRGYSASNSAVFLSYETTSLAVGKYTHFQLATHQFSEYYGEIPVGTYADVIFVTKGDHAYHYNGIPIFVNEEKSTASTQLTTGSETDLIDYINAF